MQRFLTDILNDPPYHLARIANLLLLVCVVLLGTIFLFRTDKHDITLNLSLGSEEEVFEKGEAQLAARSTVKLYPLVEIGQALEKGDTIFAEIPFLQYQEMSNWVKQLKQGKLIPTKEMLNKYPLPADIKEKMVDLAKQDAASKRVSNNKFNLEDADRMIRVKDQITLLEQEVRDLEKSIPLFEALVKTKIAKFFNERERYEREEISLEQLNKEKEKELDAKRDLRLRKEQLKTAKGRLYEFNSELKKLLKNVKIPKQKVTQDLIPFEQDLSRSIIEFLDEQVVLSKLRGKVATLGELDNVQEQDTLFVLDGSMVKKSRSKSIIVDANTADVKRISLNSISNIILKDGSTVKGIVKEFIDDTQETGSLLRIDAEEEVSYVDIEEIVLPAKNINFIEKVLQNF